jgi:hypothetical protein
MVAADHTGGQLFNSTDIHRHRAAWVEAAAPRRVTRAGHITLQDDAFTSQCCGKQLWGVQTDQDEPDRLRD